MAIIIEYLGSIMNKIWLSRRFATFFFILLSPSYCLAERPDDLYSLTFEELLRIKFTTSTLQEETLLRTPSSVSVFTRQDIDQLGVSRLEEIMNYIPGFQAYRTDVSGLQTTFSSRARRLGSAGREVLILMNGTRLNGDWAGGMADVDTYVSLENVKQIEFIRGAGSALYGSNAFLGVINIITKPDSQVELALGENNFGKVALQAQQSWDENTISLFAKTELFNGNDFKVYDSLTGQTVATRDRYKAGELYTTLETKSLKVNLRYSEREPEDFYASNFVLNDRNVFKTRVYSMTAEHQYSITSEWILETRAFFSRGKIEGKTGLSSSPGLFLTGIIEESDQGVDLRLRYTESNNLRLLFGFEFRQPKMIDTTVTRSGIADSSAPLGIDTSRTIKGAYTQYQYDFSEKFSAIAGFRHDNYSNADSRLSPRMGVMYYLSDENSFKLLYNEAFRAPTRNETDLQNSPNLTGNPDLSSEVAKTFELMWLHLSSQNYHQISLFNTEITDAVTETDTVPKTRINGDRQTIAGIEYEWKTTFREYLSWRLAVTHIFDEAKETNSESNNLLAANMSFKYSTYEINLSPVYHGGREDPNSSARGYRTIGGYTITNFYFRYLHSENWEWYLKANNVFDKQIMNPAERATNIVGAPEFGRTAIVGLRLGF